MNVVLYTFFVWFCFVQLFEIVVWYLGYVSKQEISENIILCLRISKFSLHVLGPLLLCGIALKLIKMAANKKDAMSVCLIILSLISTILIFADIITGCFTPDGINTITGKMNAIQYFMVSVCGMFSIIFVFRLFPDIHRNSNWALALAICIVSAFILHSIPLVAPVETLIVFPLGWLISQSRKLLINLF